MGDVFRKEPALIIGAVEALIALAVGFGLDITAEQMALMIGALAAILAVVTRASVFAPATVEKMIAQNEAEPPPYP